MMAGPDDVCRKCGRRLRPNGVRVADAPGTVTRVTKDLCSTCNRDPVPGKWHGEGPDPALVRWRRRFESERRTRGINPNGTHLEGDPPHHDVL